MLDGIDEEGYCKLCEANHNCHNCDVMIFFVEKFNQRLLPIVENEMTPEEIKAEQDYIRESRGKERRVF